MERKLLSLPSFFVLLLIAGIAFLAAPVADVDADAPTATLSGEVDSRENVVVTITFNEPVKLSADAQESDGTPGAATAADGFGLADLSVTRTVTLPTARDATAVTGLTAASLKGDGDATTSDVFKLTVPISPDASEGSITVTIKSTTAPTGAASFDAVADDDDYVGDGTDTHTQAYDTFAPSVTIELGEGVEDVQTGSFEVKFTLGQATATTGSGVWNPTKAPAEAPETPDADTGDITIENAAIGQTVTTDLVTRMIIVPDAGATVVKISVAAGAVADAAGNENTPATLSDVEIDNVHPTVTVAPAYPDAADQAMAASGTTPARPDKDGITTSTDGMTHSAGDATTFMVRVTVVGISVESTGAAAFHIDDDIKVTGGSVSSASADRETLALDYLYTIAQDATTETPNVVIEVAAGAVADAAGNANESKASLTVAVSGGDAPTPPPAIDPGDSRVTKLSTPKVGFQFPVDLTATNRFMVLSNGDVDEAGFTSAVTSTRVKDGVWQDLRHFLVGREGGAIDLIGPTGQKVRSLVISEVMWGNDNGLSRPSDSQWIELYNTTSGSITGTWRLEFSNKSKGLEMGANDAATTLAKPVVDKLSTWKNVGTAWEWRIEDKVGGSHGQSGKSSLNSATSPGSPVELVSMQRKIDYNKVLKDDHNDDAVKNREEQLKGIPNGAAAGGWEASKEHGDLLVYRKGTPGKPPVIRTFDKTGVPRGSVVFNEIANRNEQKQDWIELYNKSGSDKKINGWELSVVTKKDGKNSDDELFTFTSGTNGDDIVVPAKGYLLVVQTDPRNTPLEGGYDVVNPGNSARQSHGAGDKPSRLYYVSDKLNIPKEKFLLILRNGNDKTGTHEKIEDIAGHNPRFDDANINTQVWPLRSWNIGATDDLGENNGKTWVRNQGKAVFNGDEWKPDGGFTGVGIDRKYNSSGAYTSGTPGYANNAVQNEIKSDGLTHANPVIISEIMFGTGNGRVPQWIELHNPSHTQAVDLNNWKLDILNYYSDETLEVDHDATLTLPAVRIQPNQTVLIVSTTGRNSGSDEFPDDRIINVWSNTDLRNALSMSDRRDAILSTTGFYLKLSDPRKDVVDEVGNIDSNRRSNDEPAWALPGGDLDDGRRSSMVRVENTENDGEERDSWRDAVMVDSDTIKADELYYGDNEDVGTPGYTPGGVLPVQLSSFYSKRNDAGAVVITWSTESELDNAGFNILRSSSRTGEFTRINAQLIPGAGTTGEKNTYTWTDTSARPNVVYYYQIEDVSLAGEHRTLRTTRLRGYVGAAGKATTTWGDLKSRE